MLHKKLADNLSGHWALLSGSQPNSEHCFNSADVQVIYNSAEKSWSDDREHYHTNSDEIYIVLEGAMNLNVAGQSVCVGKGEYLCVERFEKHQLLSVEVPHISFVIRGPSIQDKVIT
ncbi:cupin domain-containing protein [Granulosicoccus sp.]|nr:cupin domain-containing protein [Granulosicoccus sp.]MDB4223202.1 cupin domain-containing protein [Granulosicoccus sp.]